MVSQGSKLRDDRPDSRAAILGSATEVFMASGFSGARVDDIARRAGANKAMIYYHFGSKQGLYRAVLLSLFEGILDGIKALDEAGLSPQEKLRALYTSVAGRFGETPALPHIMLRELLAGGKNMDAEASRTLGAILSFVRNTVNDGARSGVFAPVDPLLLHITMLGPLMLHFAGTSFRERVLPRELPGAMSPGNADVLNHLLEVLDRSLAPVGGGPSIKNRQRKTK